MDPHSYPVEPLTVAIRLTRPRPVDAWCLDHPYVTEAHRPPVARFLAELPRLARLCRTPQPAEVLAQQLQLPAELIVYNVIPTLVADTGYFGLDRHGEQLTLITSGATPSIPAAYKPHPSYGDIVRRYDPHCLALPDIAGRHHDYIVFRLGRLPNQHWAIDSRYSRGVWGQLLGPNPNRLLGHLAGAVDQPDEPLNIRAAAAALRVTPARLHAELDLLHRHGVIDLEHDHGAIATSGYVAAPPRHVLDANPSVAISHRCLARQGHSMQPARGLDR